MKKACLIAGSLYIPVILILFPFFGTQLLVGIEVQLKTQATPWLEYENRMPKQHGPYMFQVPYSVCQRLYQV